MTALDPAARRYRFWLSLGGLSLLAFLAVVVFDLRHARETSIGADGYSRSALGHTAFLRLLEERGVPVVQSRWRSRERASHESLLVVAEPQREHGGLPGRAGWSRLLSTPGHLLLVLPKRRALAPSRIDRGWVGVSTRVDTDDVAEVLSPLDLELVRPPLVTAVAGREPQAPEAPGAVPQAAAEHVWHTPPTWPAPDLASVQLVESGRGLEPLVFCEEGVLVGRLTPPGGPQVTLVADPDLIANHGLVRGRNAELALAVLDQARDGRLGVVWDETWHGHMREPSVSSLLLERPLGLLLGSLALLSVLATWAGAVRFGGARPAPPLLRAGKEFLVRNTADLLRAAGHSAAVLERYAHEAAREVERRLRLEGRAPDDVRAALGAAARARSLSTPDEIDALVEAATQPARRADPRALVDVAREIHQWREGLSA